MDHTPREHRGKWNALQTFFSSTWSGSAVIGGALIEHSSILFNFQLTNIIQFFAVTMNLSLIKFVKMNKHGDGTGVEDGDGTTKHENHINDENDINSRIFV